MVLCMLVFVVCMIVDWYVLIDVMICVGFVVWYYSMVLICIVMLLCVIVFWVFSCMVMVWILIFMMWLMKGIS